MQKGSAQASSPPKGRIKIVQRVKREQETWVNNSTSKSDARSGGRSERLLALKEAIIDDEKDDDRARSLRFPPYLRKVTRVHDSISHNHSTFVADDSSLAKRKPSSKSEGVEKIGFDKKYKMIETNSTSAADINFWLKTFGLDDTWSHDDYIKLNADCFIKRIGDFDYCALCGQRERASPDRLHSETRRHMDLFFELENKLASIIPKDNTAIMIAVHHLINFWLSKKLLGESHCEARVAAISDFCTLLSNFDPRCTVRVIGSFFTGTSLTDSNVNLELLHPNDKFFEQDPRDKDSIHHKLIDQDASYGNQINNHTLHYDLIPNAVSELFRIASFINQDTDTKVFHLKSNVLHSLNQRVPRIIILHGPTNTTLEIWCYAGSSHKLACLLKNYYSLDERAQHLSVIVKFWAKVCNISNPKCGTLAPSAFEVMVIYFLQRIQPPVLPCLHELLNKHGDLKHIEDVVEPLSKLDVNEQNNHDGVLEAEETEVDKFNDNNVETELENEENGDNSSAQEFNSEMIENLSWVSENVEPVHKLFIQFLQFFAQEFEETSSVISIRSLKKVASKSKRGWNSQVKAIENPLRPGVNMSQNIGSMRTFEYIKQCFYQGFFYLTSIPMVFSNGFKRLDQHLENPQKYANFYMDLIRFEFYFNMKENLIKGGTKHSINEMINQGLFARDVAIIKALIMYSIEVERDPHVIPLTLVNNFEPKFLAPPNLDSTYFCWYCKGFGHDKETCPRRVVAPIRLTADEPEFNLDEVFKGLHLSDMIKKETSEIYNRIVKELTQAICQGTGLNCELRLFGSTVNLLGTFDSDLDICMTLKDNPTGQNLNFAQILKETAVVLQQNDHVNKNSVEPILAARVPIIKFKYDHFDVDLSMYNQCAIHNSMLLRSYVLIDFRLAHLFYLVKQFAKCCGIADASRGSLSSYAWSLLVIHFLQHTSPPILPVLQEPQDKNQRPMYGVNGWNVWYNKNYSAQSEKNETCLTDLLKMFLHYYSEFNFDLYVISIRTCQLITKFEKSWTDCMIAIEDPFELTYNLSARLDDSMAFYIRNWFTRTYAYITNFQKLAATKRYGPSCAAIRKLFNGNTIMGCRPPYRGCIFCHRIGHRIKDCPEKSKKPTSRNPKDIQRIFRQ